MNEKQQILAEMMNVHGQDVWGYWYVVTKDWDAATRITASVFTEMYWTLDNHPIGVPSSTWLWANVATRPTRMRRASKHWGMSSGTYPLQPPGEPGHTNDSEVDVAVQSFLRLARRSRALLWLHLVAGMSSAVIASCRQTTRHSTRRSIDRSLKKWMDTQPSLSDDPIEAAKRALQQLPNGWTRADAQAILTQAPKRSSAPSGQRSRFGVVSGGLGILAAVVGFIMLYQSRLPATTPGPWTVTPVSVVASPSLPLQLSEKAMDLARHFGELNPEVVQFESGETNRGHQPMYRITLAGHFVDGALGSPFMNYSILTDGTKIWDISGTEAPENVVIWKEDTVTLP